MGHTTIFFVAIAMCITGCARSQQGTCGALNFHGETCTNPNQCCSDLCRWANDARTHKECYCREQNKRCTVNNQCCSYECGSNGRCTAPSPSGPVPTNPPSTASPMGSPTNPPSTSSPSTPPPTDQPTTASPTTSPPSGSCAGDLNSFCPLWLQYCTDPVFVDYMTENCCATCGAPTPAPTAAPVDGSPCSDSLTWATFCPQWVLDGHCGGGQFLGFMQIECRQSCQFCEGPTSPPAAAPTQPPMTPQPTTPPPMGPPSGGCPTGCRVRRSFTSMTNAEKDAYTTAFVRLASGAAGNALRNQFRALIDLHEIEWANGIHGPQQFLPWHRWYLVEMESLLQQVDCTVTIPYWSWENEPSGQAFNSAFWASNGFGGGNGGQCVPDGPFRQGEYSQTPRAQTTGASACIRRSRSGAIPTFSQVNSLYGISAFNYASFNGALDSLHGTVHCSIGGSMCESFTNSFGQTIFTAANAPEFFLHHANVDKIWDTWQQQSNNHLNSFSGNPDASMAATGGVTARMVRDSRSLLGTCVTYASHVSRRDLGGSGYVDHQHDGIAHPPIVDNVTDVCIPDGFLQSLERWYMLKNLSLSERQQRVTEFTAIMCGPPETLLEATGRNVSHGACPATLEQAESGGDHHTFTKHQLFAVVTGVVGVVLGAVVSWLFASRRPAAPTPAKLATSCTVTQC
eukprot:m.292703 g.292703  ORF g.292703 m.292703 type:complete len:683 (-) comp20007_c0_seq3:261-2309(-)